MVDVVGRIPFGQQLVQRRPQRVDIAAFIGLDVADHLGRGVAVGAEIDGVALLAGFEQPHDPEVRDNHPAVAAHHDVGRLHVAVDDRAGAVAAGRGGAVVGVDVVKGVCDLDRDVQEPGLAERLGLAHHGRQVAASDEFLREVVVAAVLEIVPDGHDVRVVEFGQRRGLLHKALLGLCTLGRVGLRQHLLDDAGRGGGRVMGQVDRPHAALREVAVDGIPAGAQRRPGRQRPLPDQCGAAAGKGQGVRAERGSAVVTEGAGSCVEACTVGASHRGQRGGTSRSEISLNVPGPCSSRTARRGGGAENSRENEASNPRAGGVYMT